MCRPLPPDCTQPPVLVARTIASFFLCTKMSSMLTTYGELISRSSLISRSDVTWMPCAPTSKWMQVGDSQQHRCCLQRPCRPV